MQTDVLRTEQINLKLTGDELARLERLAAHYALSPQSALRMLLKHASDVLEAQSARPRDEEGFCTAILDLVAKHEKLHSEPMPLGALVQWHDMLSLPGATVFFNMAIERLTKDGRVVRKGQMFSINKPSKRAK